MGLGSSATNNGRGRRIMEHRKYKREQKAQDDKQQTKLDFSSPTFVKSKQQKKVDMTVQHTGTYMCPFCLHQDKFEKYLIISKKGFDKRLGKCPECSKQMMLRTLTEEMTPEQFAQFAFNYAADGYWQKVSFDKFNKRLREIGWLKPFWLKYKQLKGDDTTETYIEYMTRQQEEWAREAGILKE